MSELLAASTNTERAYERLRSEILRGDLMPGDRLTAADLQERFSLGITPIREALTRLSVEGLVETENHRGAKVANVSTATFTDLMSTRRSIERLCLEASIANGDEIWEAEVLAAMHMLSRTPLPSSSEDRGAAALWEERHRRFHLALVSACGSEWLLRFWNMLVDHTERFRKLRLLHRHTAEAEVRDVNDEHRAIMNAVLARDATAAIGLMDLHLAKTNQSVLRLLEAGYAPREEF
mgnify:FL=1